MSVCIYRNICTCVYIVYLICVFCIYLPKFMFDSHSTFDYRPYFLGFTFNATDLPSEDYYDYIVVGGGTAGCPLAATL